MPPPPLPPHCALSNRKWAWARPSLLQHDANVVIAKLDATANDIPSPKISVRGYPTLVLVTANGDGAHGYAVWMRCVGRQPQMAGCLAAADDSYSTVWWAPTRDTCLLPPGPHRCNPPMPLLPRSDHVLGRPH